MAIFHSHVQVISRGKGKSAVAAAAYRAGETITNEHDGTTHDYTRKGGIVHTEILLPGHAPIEYSDRAVLWNAVEKIEKADNSQLARELDIALPVELTREQYISLAREYVKLTFVAVGMCADLCVHDKGDGNPHAHIMLTMRPFNKDKSWGDKQKKEYVLDKNGEKIYDPKKRQYKCKSIPTTDWNEQTKAEQWRAAWADAVNTVLERQGTAERVDHRSYERQGIEQLPTVHMGVAAMQMERKGIATERGNRNREIAHANGLLSGILAKLKQLKDWLKEIIAPTTPPTFADIVRGILDGSERRTNCGSKAAERLLDFLQENNIATLPELREKVAEMNTRFFDIRGSLKFYEGRLKTLDEHIRQGEIYMAHQELYAQYQQVKPRKQPKFYESHRADLMLFEAAKRYLDAHYIKPGFPIQVWKEKRTELAAEHGKVYREYAELKSEAMEVDSIRHAAVQIVREINSKERQRKPQPRTLERQDCRKKSSDFSLSF